MRTLKLTIAYDGTPFVGWQRQARGVSIQGLVEAAIARIEGAAVTVTGAGRTDAGVHALAQVASVVLAHQIPVAMLARALNATLPPEIRVLRVEEEAAGFSARFGASRKTYRYRLLNAPVGHPFERRYAWHVPRPLNRDAMRAALQPFVGRHDFAAFRAAGSSVATTVRTMFQARLVEEHGCLAGREDPPSIVAFEMSADGFLRHMVRNIVGTIVDVGLGQRAAGDVAALLGLRDRGAAGPTAPPQGLFLVHVDYGDVARALGDLA